MEYNYKNEIKINETLIGVNHTCYIMAEIGINHNGQLSIAKKLIDVAVDAGANAAKFQKRDLKSLFRDDVLTNPSLDSQGTEILIQVLKDVELSKQDYHEIINYCKERNITFLCTPWDKPSVDFLEELGVTAYKIASADMTNFPLIEYISRTKKPIIISTGMSTLEEIDRTVNFVKKQDSEFLLLHCNSTYPSPVEILNLNLIPVLQSKFNVPIGYSGHETGIIPSLTAAIMGAVLIERHITLDKSMEGLDQAASLEPNEFKTLIKFIREAEMAKGTAEKKISRGEILQREILGKSLVCSSSINKGEEFTENNIEVKGPARGLLPQHYYEIMGKKSPRNIKKGEYLLNSDLT